MTSPLTDSNQLDSLLLCTWRGHVHLCKMLPFRFAPFHTHSSTGKRLPKRRVQGRRLLVSVHQILLKEGWHLAGNSHKNICHLTSKCKIIRKGQQGLEANKLLQN